MRFRQPLPAGTRRSIASTDRRVTDALNSTRNTSKVSAVSVTNCRIPSSPTNAPSVPVLKGSMTAAG